MLMVFVTTPNASLDKALWLSGLSHLIAVSIHDCNLEIFHLLDQILYDRIIFPPLVKILPDTILLPLPLSKVYSSVLFSHF